MLSCSKVSCNHFNLWTAVLIYYLIVTFSSFSSSFFNKTYITDITKTDITKKKNPAA